MTERNRVLYSGVETTPTSVNEFRLARNEEATLGLYGAVSGDEITIQHKVGTQWVNTIVLAVPQKLSSTNTLLGLRGARTFRVLRTGGTSSLIVDITFD